MSETTTSTMPTASTADEPMVVDPNKLVLSLREAAAVSGINYWTLREYVSAGYLATIELPPVPPRPGAKAKERLRRVLIAREDLMAFIASRRTKVVVQTVRYIPAETNLAKLLAEVDAANANTARELAGFALSTEDEREAVPMADKPKPLPTVADLRAELERRRPTLALSPRNGGSSSEKREG